jgi:lysophospholipase L1-like esterase
MNMKGSFTHNSLSSIKRHTGRIVWTILLWAVGCGATVVAETTNPVLALKITRSAAGDVTITRSVSGATLRYSLDGSEPSSDSFTYFQPFPLPDGGTIKARAYDKDNRVLGGTVAVTFEKITAAASADYTLSDWHGYQKKSFALNDVPAYVVAPKIAAPGKPWIWRTSWPDYHSEVDQELLRCGFHVAYIETVDLLGSDKALDIMDGFYDAVRSRFGLAEKCAIEPNSRGGLHAYRYTARHPERIACLLGDVPVMDFKSWPSPRDADQWRNILNSYGFKDNAEAMAYVGNPVDEGVLAPIARARIPLRHTICLTDGVVPPKDNTFKAQAVLKKLGWDIDLVVVPDSKDCNGHHFPFPKAFESAQFVLRHAAVPSGKSPEYFELRNGLANCKAKFEKQKVGRIVFLGGSITSNGGWRDELMRYFRQRFPETKFDFIATGVPSVGSLGHAFRLDDDVLSRGPVDLVFVEAAVNDHNYDSLKDGPALALRGMEGVVRQLRMKSPMTDVVQMHFVHNIHLATWKAGRVPYTIEAHEKVAAYYGCPSLNLSKEVAERIAAGQFTWDGDFRDLHPSPYGQHVYSNSMVRMLDAAFQTDVAPKAHALPAKPLDEQSFFHGRHGRLADAVLVKGFALEQNWVPKTGQEMRSGYSRCPAITADSAGAEMTYTFEGTAFGLFLAAGRDTGVIAYSTDGAPFKDFDTWSPWSGALNFPLPVILENGLKPGKHTITIRTTDRQKSRQALHIIHVLLN